jgi:branched-chain amino acid transport system ATP-binding protein
LSPGDRGTLTALLRSLPKSITIVLIEHDMDVALGFAEFVMVMHNGRVFCEGLPAAIAADPRVHEIYMGHRHG